MRANGLGSGTKRFAEHAFLSETLPGSTTRSSGIEPSWSVAPMRTRAVRHELQNAEQPAVIRVSVGVLDAARVGNHAWLRARRRAPVRVDWDLADHAYWAAQPVAGAHNCSRDNANASCSLDRAASDNPAGKRRHSSTCWRAGGATYKAT